jgi:hypothetical protein
MCTVFLDWYFWHCPLSLFFSLESRCFIQVWNHLCQEAWQNWVCILYHIIETTSFQKFERTESINSVQKAVKKIVILHQKPTDCFWIMSVLLMIPPQRLALTELICWVVLKQNCEFKLEFVHCPEAVWYNKGGEQQVSVTTDLPITDWIVVEL